MSAVSSLPEARAELSALVRAGEFRAARALGRKLLKVVDVRELWLIALSIEELENRPHTAVALLRHWQDTAPTDADRAIIAACMPEQDAPRRRAESDTGRAPAWNGRNNYQAPSTVTTTQRNDVRRRRRSRQQQQDAAAFTQYREQRAGVREGDQLKDRDERAQDAQVYASGFDYDRAALHGTEEPFRCLSCRISRGRYDLDGDRIKDGHGDDGLCAECRDSGRPGIPELPAGHSVADAVTARCSFYWAELGTVAARVALRVEWQQAAKLPEVREAIADYVTANLPAEKPTEEEADTPALTACQFCAAPRSPRDYRQVRKAGTDDGLCGACRELSAEYAAA